MSTTSTKSSKPDKIDAILDGEDSAEVMPWERKTALPVVEVEPIDFHAISALSVPETTETPISDLVPTDDEEYAPIGRQYSEFLDFDSEDLHIPRLRLLSGQSQEVTEGKGRSGQFLIFGHAPVDAVELVIVATTPYRDYRVGEDRVQMCKSNDGKVGIGDPGGICKLCSKSKWGEKNPITGKSKAPECSDGFSYQIYSLTHGDMAVWDLSRTGLDAARKINSSLKIRKYRNFVVLVGTEQRDGPARSKYHVPIIEVRAITRAEREQVDASVFN